MLGLLCLLAFHQPRHVQPSEVLVSYAKWTRVNPSPIAISSRLDLLCRSLTPEEISLYRQDPHRTKFITVYVNPVGREAMMHQAKPKFPVGSVIVKEKHLTQTDAILSF